MFKIGTNLAVHMETYVSYIVAGDKFSINIFLYNTSLLLFTVIVVFYIVGIDVGLQYRGEEFL